MASRLEMIARNAVGSNITDGREPIKTADIIAKYPDGVCITSIAKNTYNGSTYPVFTFAEDSSKYFSGGKALSQMVDNMLDEYDGNMALLNEDLSKEYLKVKLVKTKTKRGYNFTRVVIVGIVPAKFFNKVVEDDNGNLIDTETGEVIENDVGELTEDVVPF